MEWMWAKVETIAWSVFKWLSLTLKIESFDCKMQRNTSFIYLRPNTDQRVIMICWYLIGIGPWKQKYIYEKHKELVSLNAGSIELARIREPISCVQQHQTASNGTIETRKRYLWLTWYFVRANLNEHEHEHIVLGEYCEKIEKKNGGETTVYIRSMYNIYLILMAYGAGEYGFTFMFRVNNNLPCANLGVVVICSFCRMSCRKSHRSVPFIEK